MIGGGAKEVGGVSKHQGHSYRIWAESQRIGGGSTGCGRSLIGLGTGPQRWAGPPSARGVVAGDGRNLQGTWAEPLNVGGVSTARGVATGERVPGTLSGPPRTLNLSPTRGGGSPEGYRPVSALGSALSPGAAGGAKWPQSPSSTCPGALRLRPERRCDPGFRGATPTG